MNRISRFLFLSAIVAGTSLGQRALCEGQFESFALSFAPETSSAMERAAAQDDPVYAQGTKAMDEQRWADAVTSFDKVATAKGKNADAALYWKAYSLQKLDRKDESRATCDTLRQKEPSSSWNRECMVLRVRTNIDVEGMKELARNSATLTRDMDHMKMEFGPGFEGGEGFHVLYGKNHVTTEDDIKILALNSLMRSEPAKALPLLRDMLHSDKSVEMKRQALFVLSRSKDPQAQSIVTEFATTSSDPKLQTAAIEIMAVGRGKDAGPALVQIYRSSSDADVKRAAENGLFIAHDAPHLVELARAEKDLNRKRDIVSQLALMKDPVATDYMLELLK
jgi:hypothetical protein